jgi:hypothetical protein
LDPLFIIISEIGIAVFLPNRSNQVPWLQKLFIFAPIPPEVLGLSVISAFVSLAAANAARRWIVS